MFIPAIFTIAKIGNQPKCLSMDDWIKKCDIRPSVVAHACNPSTLRGPRQVDHLRSGIETSLANMVKPCLY